MSGLAMVRLLAALALSCLLAIGILFATGAQAQEGPQIPRCAPHAAMVKAIADAFDERPAFVGLLNETALVEGFLSSKSTWTIILTTDKGMSCVFASGEDFQLSTDAFKPGKPS